MPRSGSYFYPGLNAGFDYNPIPMPANVSLSSTFTGDTFSVVLGPVDVSKYKNYKVTMINNHATNPLKSGTVEVSNNGANWEVINSVTFQTLATSTLASVQFTGSSNQSLRVRAWPSGSGGQTTGSLQVILTAN